MYDNQFCLPFQEIYENMVPDEVRSRYTMVIDGEVLATKYQLDYLRYGLPASTLGELNKSLASGTTALSGVPGRYLLREVGRRIRHRAGVLFRRSP
jgi:hypothetical protein